MATAETLLMTAAEFSRLPETGRFTELVRGRIVEMNLPGTRHGKVCANVARILGNHVADQDLGHVMSNDCGIVTQHDPDTIRGADVCFYSYARLPKGPVPMGYPSVVPDLVFEIRSPSDRWSAILEKVAEYLHVGVPQVLVLDPETATVQVYSDKQPTRVLSESDVLTLPEILGDFEVPVRSLFA